MLTSGGWHKRILEEERTVISGVHRQAFAKCLAFLLVASLLCASNPTHGPLFVFFFLYTLLLNPTS
tara:strand:+ start:1216 stop:1413 length:198 start_codon:yes stop_codon:yes gene_type:complete